MAECLAPLLRQNGDQQDAPMSPAGGASGGEGEAGRGARGGREGEGSGNEKNNGSFRIHACWVKAGHDVLHERKPFILGLLHKVQALSTVSVPARDRCVSGVRRHWLQSRCGDIVSKLHARFPPQE